MKAAVLREVDRPLEVEEVEVDRLNPREVLIRTGASGVCHSDLHFVEGKYTIDMPAVLGHEASGTIEAVGEQVTYVRPGDRVITWPYSILRPLRPLPQRPPRPVPTP
jgi:S-(hydroxymethyl)glutathione dehydrogenase/alcohol dehydrogenase